MVRTNDKCKRGSVGMFGFKTDRKQINKCFPNFHNAHNNGFTEENEKREFIKLYLRPFYSLNSNIIYFACLLLNADNLWGTVNTKLSRTACSNFNASENIKMEKFVE